MLSMQKRIEIKRRHDQKQAIINLVEFATAMIVLILLCAINDQTIDNLFM